MSDNWLVVVVKGPRRIHQLNADDCLRPLRDRDLSLRFLTTVHQHHISSSFQNPPPPPPLPSPHPHPHPLPSIPVKKTRESSSIGMSTRAPWLTTRMKPASSPSSSPLPAILPCCLPSSPCRWWEWVGVPRREMNAAIGSSTQFR